MADSVEDADGSKAEVFFEVVEGVSRGADVSKNFRERDWCLDGEYSVGS